MPRHCKICDMPESVRRDVERMYDEGESIDEITFYLRSLGYNIHRSSVYRHMKNHHASLRDEEDSLVLKGDVKLGSEIKTPKEIKRRRRAKGNVGKPLDDLSLVDKEEGGGESEVTPASQKLVEKIDESLESLAKARKELWNLYELAKERVIAEGGKNMVSALRLLNAIRLLEVDHATVVVTKANIMTGGEAELVELFNLEKLDELLERVVELREEVDKRPDRIEETIETFKHKVNEALGVE